MKTENDIVEGKKVPVSLWRLFINMFYISAFTFGGGFVIVTLMKKKYCDEYHWLSEDEILDITSLAQSSPGAIAVNAAILIGWRTAGILGMIVSVVGTMIPPIVILTVISFFYKAFSSNKYVSFALKGMQAGVAAVILDVVCDLGKKVFKTKSPVFISVMILAFIAVFFINVNVIYIIATAVIIGLGLALIKRRKEAHNDIS